jgi:23S rRNA (cytosine1962-C5)-methyltransferase
LSKIYLKKNEDKRIKHGHLWVFSNEIAKKDDGIESGDIITLYDAGGNILGKGFFNSGSLISVRLLSKKFNDNFAEYAKEMILNATALRKSFYPDRSSYRLVFSESDFMPGLIIDKYNDTYVLQVYCFGMDKNIDAVVDVLKNDLGAKNIFTRNEPYFRKLEGLPEEDKIFLGEISREVIDDGKLKYIVNLAASQKTGFYFDQSDNREFIEKISADKNVLDAFCNSGGFGMHAASAGAGMITFVDSSDPEIKNAKKNFEENSLKGETEFVTSDIFEYLEKCRDANRKFDVVMIDPPAFAKSRKSIPTALKGYIKLNRYAMECISDGGYLVSSSCSHHIKQEDFLTAISSAASRGGRQIQLVHYNGASLDHPQLPAMDETSYLKFAVFKIM